MINFDLMIYLLLSIFIVGSLGIWIYLFFILKKSFHFSPIILKSNKINTKKNLVSIIIPARNEEKYIRRLYFEHFKTTLYTIMKLSVVDDNSSDKTLEILLSFKNNNNTTKIKIFKAGKKPEDWVGKNWPCYVGYKNSRGESFTFYRC